MCATLWGDFSQLVSFGWVLKDAAVYLFTGKPALMPAGDWMLQRYSAFHLLVRSWGGASVAGL